MLRKSSRLPTLDQALSGYECVEVKKRPRRNSPEPGCNGGDSRTATRARVHQLASTTSITVFYTYSTAQCMDPVTAVVLRVSAVRNLDPVQRVKGSVWTQRQCFISTAVELGASRCQFKKATVNMLLIILNNNGNASVTLN